jgi:hypothetical protein
VAWEDASLSIFARFYRTVAKAISRPKEFVDELPPGGGHGPAITFLLALFVCEVSIPMLLCWLPALFLGLGGPAFNQLVGAKSIESILVVGFGFLLIAILAPVLGILAFYLWASIVHVAGKIAGLRGPFEYTARACAYGSAPMALNIFLMPLILLPIIGILAQLGGYALQIWQIVLTVMAVRQLHETTVGRAVVAVLAPIAVCCGLACALWGLFFAFAALAAGAAIQ